MFNCGESINGFQSVLEGSMQTDGEGDLEAVSPAKHSLLEEILTTELGLFTCSANVFGTSPVPLAEGEERTDEDKKITIETFQQQEDESLTSFTGQAKRTSSRLQQKRKAMDNESASCKMDKAEIEELELCSVAAVKSRTPRTKVADNKKDDKYWERRRRNNLAAKRSRESKRAYHMEVAQKTVLLEKENAELRKTLQNLKAKIDKTERKLCKTTEKK